MNETNERTDNTVMKMDNAFRTMNQINGQRDNETDKGRNNVTEKQINYERNLTVQIELNGEEAVTTMELMKCIRDLCGGLIACRLTGNRKYEITMTNPTGKNRLMDGFKIGTTSVIAKELSNDELVVSFLGLPAYITDEDIVEKLHGWGVSAVSPIKRRMWPGTRIADGTRFVKVKFNNTVQSLPYSARFNTATGQEHFRVIHDRQVKVCRMCIQPGHILRECPEFMCHKCGVQGHYARECVKIIRRCELCHNNHENCVCHNSEDEEGVNEGSGVDLGESESNESRGEEGGDEMECASEAAAAEEACASGTGTERLDGERAVRALEQRSSLSAVAPSRSSSGQNRQTEARSEAGKGSEPADLPASNVKLSPAAAPSLTIKAAENVSPSGESSLLPAPMSGDSDSDIDTQVKQMRKRQNPAKQEKTSKRTKAKKKT